MSPPKERTRPSTGGGLSNQSPASGSITKVYDLGVRRRRNELEAFDLLRLAERLDLCDELARLAADMRDCGPYRDALATRDDAYRLFGIAGRIFRLIEGGAA